MSTTTTRSDLDVALAEVKRAIAGAIPTTPAEHATEAVSWARWLNKYGAQLGPEPLLDLARALREACPTSTRIATRGGER